MSMKYKKSKIRKYKISKFSCYKQEQLIHYFVSGTTARCTSELVGIHRNTSIVYFCRLREIIAYQLELKITEYFSGDIAVDESYFGGTRKGKRGRGAGGNPPVFVLLKRGCKVHTKIIPDASSATLIPINKDKQ